MTDLTRLVAAPGANSTRYVDPVFPDRPLVLHAARPRQYDARTPVLFVHHGVRRNGGEYRDYWLDLVDEAGILAISIEFPEASFPEYLWYNFGNLHAKDDTPNPRETLTRGSSRSCAREASRYTKAMDCSVTPRAASTSTECCPLDFATALPPPSAPMPAPTQCRI